MKKTHSVSSNQILNQWEESCFHKKIVKIFTVIGDNGISAMQKYFHEKLKLQFLCNDKWFIIIYKS